MNGPFSPSPKQKYTFKPESKPNPFCRYARAQLPDGKLGELVDLVSTVGFGENINNGIKNY